MRFLVIALDNLGDAVMATAAARALKERCDGAQVGIWTKAYSARALHGAPDLDFVHGSDPFWDASPGAEKGGWGPFRETLREVRGQGYDAAFVLGTEWRRALCGWLSGAAQRVGYPVRKSWPFLTKRVSWEEHGPHTIDDHLTLVERFFGTKIEHSACLPRLALSPYEKELREKLRASAGAGPLVILHPFSGDPRRQWPMKGCCELIEELSARLPACRFALFIGPKDEALVDRRSGALSRRNVWLPQDQSIACMKAAMSLASLFIGTDSGPGHIAAALGVPVLSLAGPHSQVERHRPWGKAVRLLRPDSMEGLCASAVADAAQGLL